MSKELDVIIQKTIEKYYFTVRILGSNSPKAKRLHLIVNELVEMKQKNNKSK
ncbi:hypothetical protein GCM10008967_00460 [Bacillus carboniphilus]|uniref:50S ribosomal protein L29 n=1 Tax=Bacillus carboniphilus TaxID=86663 RepID=A0ABN0VPA4_9BACI